MEMEVMMPSPPAEFNFESSCTTPYISAPSSPQRFGSYFFSAPTSPTQSSAFYRDFNNFRDAQIAGRHVSAVPFDWEVKPGIPKSKDNKNTIILDDDDGEEEDDSRDFAFDFSGHLETRSLTADELFDGGKIKPLKPPPRLQFYHGKFGNDSLSPRSPRSPKKLIKDALSPRHNRKKDFDPFAAAHEQTCRDFRLQERGRERTNNNDNRNSSNHQKKTRSLSPFRVSDLLLDESNAQGPNSNSKFSSSSFGSFWYKKWKLKDLLLFRSASEGRANNKGQMKKYAMLNKNLKEDVKNSSFRSTDSVGSTTSSSSSRRRGPISAHEQHYTANRAVREEMKKKTFLPYKQNLLGCLSFTSNMPMHEISKGLDSLRGRRDYNA